MHLPTRAASLCAVALTLAALAPAATQAFTTIEPAEGETMHNRIWPGTVASGMDAQGTPAVMVPEIVSPGACDPGEGTRTFTFSYADRGVVLWADGHFEEQGSFTLDRVGDEVRVTAFDSTFSGSSSHGTIAGERHMSPLQAELNGSVTCRGTSDADRFMLFQLNRVPTVHTLTTAAGAVVVERGFAMVGLASDAPNAFGHYVSLFESDADGDGHSRDYDNCDDVYNSDQLDADGDGIGDACEGGGGRPADTDGDTVFDRVDNCVDVPNPSQANVDEDELGDACDPDYDPGAFESTDGFAGGGGKTAGDVHLSVALHSRGGTLHGSGDLAADATRVRLLDLTGLRSDGNQVVAIGNASVDGGVPRGYRLEIVDSANTFGLEVGDRRWTGTLANGNLVVK